MTHHQEGEAAADERAVLAKIRGARATWRTAEAISAETGIPLDRVCRALDTSSADVITAAGVDPDSRTLYSTREHYRRTTSVLRRYFEMLASS